MKRLPNLTRWPEPPPDEGEKPQWVIVAVLAVAVALGVWLARQNDGAGGSNFSLRLPEISLPQVSAPQISLPDFDLRGRESAQPSASPEATQSITEATPPFADEAGPVVRSMPFETCADMVAESASRLGQQVSFVEKSADRLVARFMQGAMTMTCSRADGTLTIERNGNP